MNWIAKYINKGHLHSYVKRDIEKYMFPTIAGNLGIRILGVYVKALKSYEH